MFDLNLPWKDHKTGNPCVGLQRNFVERLAAVSESWSVKIKWLNDKTK